MQIKRELTSYTLDNDTLPKQNFIKDMPSVANSRVKCLFFLIPPLGRLQQGLTCPSLLQNYPCLELLIYRRGSF